MTHKEHAEKVWEDAHCAFAEGALDGGGTEEAASIIAAALEKQRDACQSELEQQLGGILLTHPWMRCPDVRSAEVYADPMDGTRRTDAEGKRL